MRRTLLTLVSAFALSTMALAAPAKAQGKLDFPANLNEKAPATFKAKFDTSKGVFVVEVNRDWAPNGADRFYNLVKNGFYDDVRFFRVISGFMVQFGINGNPKISAPWREARIADDPVKQSNKRGYHHLCDGAGRTPAPAKCSSTSTTTPTSTTRLRAVRPDHLRHGRGRQAQRRIRRGRAARAAGLTRAGCRRKATPI